MKKSIYRSDQSNIELDDQLEGMMHMGFIYMITQPVRFYFLLEIFNKRTKRLPTSPKE